MYISSKKDQIIIEGTTGDTVVVALSAQTLPAEIESNFKYVGNFNDGERAKDIVIASPGEFEYHGLDIVAFDVKADQNALANLFKITLDNVHTLVVTDKPDSLSKQDWELLGDVHIILVDEAVYSDSVTTLISKVQPHIVMVRSTAGETFGGSHGITVESTAKKFSFKAKDFPATEEVVAKYYVLGT